jgi:hypothetical protein
MDKRLKNSKEAKKQDKRVRIDGPYHKHKEKMNRLRTDYSIFVLIACCVILGHNADEFLLFCRLSLLSLWQ